MKTQLDLNQMGLVEMNSNEMLEVDGGGFFGALLGFVVGAIVGLIVGGEGEINGTEVPAWEALGGIGALIGSLLPF